MEAQEIKNTYALPPVEVLSTELDPFDFLLPKENRQIGFFQTDQTLSQESVFSLSHSLPVLLSRGKSGQVVALKSVGAQAKKTRIEFFNVPFSSPGGLSVDLGTLPGFLWKQGAYAFSLPSFFQSGFSQNPTSETLVLVPWTQWALDKPRTFELFQSASSASGFDLGVGVREKNVAILGGFRAGNQMGPAGSMSWRFFEKNTWKADVHLFGSQIETPSYGTETFLTPNAKQTTEYLLGTLELQGLWFASLWGKTQVTFQKNQLVYENPDSSFEKLTRNEQWKGSVWQRWSTQRWEASLGGEGYQFSKDGRAFPAFLDWEGSVGGKFSFLKDQVRFFPSFRLHGILGKVFPEALMRLQFGWLHTHTWNGQWFQESSWQVEPPSVLDRYYEIPGVFVPNAQLQPQKMLTFQTGIEIKREDLFESRVFLKWEDVFQVHQKKRLLSKAFQVVNQGKQKALWAQEQMRYQVFSWLQWKQHGAWLLTPKFVLGLPRAWSVFQVFSKLPSRFWLQLQMKWVGTTTWSLKANASPYRLWSLSFGADRVFQWFGEDQWSFQVAFENLFQEKYFSGWDQRGAGREVSVSIEARL